MSTFTRDEYAYADRVLAAYFHGAVRNARRVVDKPKGNTKADVRAQQCVLFVANWLDSVA